PTVTTLWRYAEAVGSQINLNVKNVSAEGGKIAPRQAGSATPPRSRLVIKSGADPAVKIVGPKGETGAPAKKPGPSTQAPRAAAVSKRNSGRPSRGVKMLPKKGS